MVPANKEQHPQYLAIDKLLEHADSDSSDYSENDDESVSDPGSRMDRLSIKCANLRRTE